MKLKLLILIFLIISILSFKTKKSSFLKTSSQSDDLDDRKLEKYESEVDDLLTDKFVKNPNEPDLNNDADSDELELEEQRKHEINGN